MVSRISRLNLEQYYMWAKENRSRGENGGNEHLASLKAMLRWGEEMQLCEVSFKHYPKCVALPLRPNGYRKRSWRFFSPPLLTISATCFTSGSSPVCGPSS